MGTSWGVTFAATTGTGGGADAGTAAPERWQAVTPIAPEAPAATSKAARTRYFWRMDDAFRCVSASVRRRGAGRTRRWAHRRRPGAWAVRNAGHRYADRRALARRVELGGAERNGVAAARAEAQSCRRGDHYSL